MNNARSGVVIFTGNKERLAGFYRALTGLPVRASDASVTVLASAEFELVIHALAGEPVSESPIPRGNAYVKPFFPVASLSEARRRAAALGGSLRPREEEWTARGFRACEASDPDGNAIQFRQDDRSST